MNTNNLSLGVSALSTIDAMIAIYPGLSASPHRSLLNQLQITVLRMFYDTEDKSPLPAQNEENVLASILTCLQYLADEARRANLTDAADHIITAKKKIERSSSGPVRH